MKFIYKFNIQTLSVDIESFKNEFVNTFNKYGYIYITMKDFKNENIISYVTINPQYVEGIINNYNISGNIIELFISSTSVSLNQSSKLIPRLIINKDSKIVNRFICFDYIIKKERKEKDK